MYYLFSMNLSCDNPLYTRSHLSSIINPWKLVIAILKMAWVCHPLFTDKETGFSPLEQLGNLMNTLDSMSKVTWLGRGGKGIWNQGSLAQQLMLATVAFIFLYISWRYVSVSGIDGVLVKQVPWGKSFRNWLKWKEEEIISSSN